MSSPIWTPDALASELRAFSGRGWRVVEAQHLVSTLKIVDDLEEQQVLEDILEETKPPLPEDCRGLHYLLATPFRYGAVYPFGSRFRRAGRTPGVFYAAQTPETAIAEAAFWRLLFYAESPDTPWPSDAADYTAFAAAINTGAAIDLTEPPLDADREAWTRFSDYGACQDLAESARAAGAALIRYDSVRDPAGGANLAVLACAAFAAPEPVAHQSHRLRVGAFGVQAICDFPLSRIEFGRGAFAADPRLAALNWERG